MWREADERAHAEAMAHEEDNMAADADAMTSVESLTHEQKEAIVLASDVMTVWNSACMKSIRVYHGRWMCIIVSRAQARAFLAENTPKWFTMSNTEFDIQTWCPWQIDQVWTLSSECVRDIS